MSDAKRLERLAQAEAQARELLDLIQQAKQQLDLFYSESEKRIAALAESVRAAVSDADGDA